MIPRLLQKQVKKAAKEYPVVTIVGPRQSGKTTLVRAIFTDKPYLSLEDPDTRAYAQEDPRGFLNEHPQGAIFDEIQRVPDLFSYIQGIVDKEPVFGKYILTGSQHFLMMRDVSQSLAGRTAILTLLPLSLGELHSFHKALPSMNELLYQGFYPAIYNRKMEPTAAYRNYFMTYVERDARSLLNVQNLQTFETFVRLCAGQVGQLLNLTSLGNDAGISATTAKDWLHLLETSFILFRLPPYHTNLRKRLVKTPKLYFYDVGLASYLCGMENERHFQSHPLRGHLFENMIVTELLKRRFNQGKDSRMLFYRDTTGNEIDVLYPIGPDWLPVEIKSGQTIASDWFRNFEVFQKIRKDQGSPGVIVYGGDKTERRSKGSVTNPWSLNSLLDELEKN